MRREYLTAVGVCLGSLIVLPATASAQTFTNAAAITIPGSGTGATTGAPATPYPSNIVVSGIAAPIARVSITLNGLSHTFPDDVDVLLVAPDGTKMVVLSDVGSSNDAVGFNITLDDNGAQLTDSGAFASGVYQPANFGTVV